MYLKLFPLTETVKLEKEKTHLTTSKYFEIEKSAVKWMPQNTLSWVGNPSK